MPVESNRLLRWWRRRRALKRQRTFIYCPECKLELIASGSWMGTMLDPRLEAYICTRCGTWSTWNFDIPAPFCVKASTDAPG